MVQTTFSILGFSAHWYGLLVALGIGAGALLAALREQRLGLSKDTALDITLVGVPCAIVGARLYYVLFSLEEYINQPLWRIFAVWEGGLAIYGGLIGAILGGLIYSRVKRLPMSALLDLAAPGFALGQCIGRWGNFVNGEAYGVVVERAAWQRFPLAVNIGGTWHAATFFYESAWCLLIVLVLLFMERRALFVRRGDTFLWYALLYALERAVVEGLRMDSLYWGSMRVSQLLSALLAAAIFALWAYRAKQARPVCRLGVVALQLTATVLLARGQLLAGLALEAVALTLGAILYLWIDKHMGECNHA